MNDTEDRLRDLLHEAVPRVAVPADVLSSAACRAAQVRRRRVAMRGALGVAAVVATGAVAQRERVPGADRIAPLASHAPTAAASQASASGVRLTASGECETGTAAVRCQRLTLELVRPGEEPQRFILSERYAPGDPTYPVPPRRLVLTLADGTERSAPPRQVGPAEWMFDLDLRQLDEFDTFTLVTSADQLEIHIYAS